MSTTPSSMVPSSFKEQTPATPVSHNSPTMANATNEPSEQEQGDYIAAALLNLEVNHPGLLNIPARPVAEHRQRPRDVWDPRWYIGKKERATFEEPVSPKTKAKKMSASRKLATKVTKRIQRRAGCQEACTGESNTGSNKSYRFSCPRMQAQYDQCQPASEQSTRPRRLRAIENDSKWIRKRQEALVKKMEEWEQSSTSDME